MFHVCVVSVCSMCVTCVMCVWLCVHVCPSVRVHVCGSMLPANSIWVSLMVSFYQQQSVPRILSQFLPILCYVHILFYHYGHSQEKSYLINERNSESHSEKENKAALIIRCFVCFLILICSTIS